ncbi:MAG: nucleotidyltransferase domain-containing protein, partial [bacterium]|nr:nucleotidyltransferase domain-containing protein [bacterium]
MRNPFSFKDKTVMKLKKYFTNREDIIMAFLFGSWVKGGNGIESDMDIAVYFKPKTGILEWEANTYYDNENSIWLEIERIVQREVDLLVLNRASATIAESALKGIPIIIKDHSFYIDFLLRITSEAIDFRDWIESYWSLKEKRRYGS